MSLQEKFDDLTSSIKTKKDQAVDYMKTKYENSVNIFSNFNTIFTGSTSASAGITESVITPGIRFIKFVSGIMQVYKKLSYNLTTIKNKLTNISNKLSAFSNGNYEHVRQSVIKRKVNNN